MNEPTKRRAIGMKRIQRAKDKERIIALLTHESAGVFREMWRLMIFAAFVGFKNQRRDPLSVVQGGEGIRQDVFTNNPVWQGSSYLMTLVAMGSADALRATEEAEDERIKVFEEYANGGLAVLEQELINSDGDLDSLLGFIQDHAADVSTKVPDLDVTI